MGGVGGDEFVEGGGESAAVDGVVAAGGGDVVEVGQTEGFLALGPRFEEGGEREPEEEEDDGYGEDDLHGGPARAGMAGGRRMDWAGRLHGQEKDRTC